MNNNRAIKIISLLILAGMLVGAAAFAFPEPVTAAPLNQEGTSQLQANQDQLKQQHKQRLERLYQRERRLIEHLNADLSRVGIITDRVDTLINRLEQNGIDPTPVQNALSEFIQQTHSAAGLRDEAASILAEDNGFNPQGKVTNVQDPAQTVRSAGSLLRDAHHTFHEALRQLHTIIRGVIGG
jgi:hypothetical protein